MDRFFILRHRVFTLLMSLSFIVLSCTDLDETTYDIITSESTPLTADDVESLIAPAYTSLRDVYWGWDSFWDNQEESSDMFVTTAKIGGGWGGSGVIMHPHKWDGYIENIVLLWERSYQGINNANRAMFQIQQLDNLDNKDAIINELRGLRAFYYYILLDNFRNVPIVTEFDVPEGFLPEQNTAQEVFDFIEHELNEVLPTLSAENTAHTYGKFTQWAARMVLAKLYLNAGVYFGTPRWNEALQQVQEVINSGLFTLATNYRDPFITENQQSVEEIFSIPMDEIYAQNMRQHLRCLDAISQRTFNLQNAPYNGTITLPQFINTYDPDDSRLDDTFLHGLQFSSTGEPLMRNGQQYAYINYLSELMGTQVNEGFRFVKYEIRLGALTYLSNDTPFFRYTDALMIKAECLLRMGDTEGAATIVTEIRQRAFRNNPMKAKITGDDLMKGSSYVYGGYKNGTMQNIEGGDDIPYGRFLDELGWEFVGEHHRRQDLIRFGVFTRKSWFEKKPSEAHRIYFPIPTVQLNTNPNLKQNPGY